MYFKPKPVRVKKQDLCHHSENPRSRSAERLPRSSSSRVYLNNMIVTRRWKTQDFHTWCVHKLATLCFSSVIFLLLYVLAHTFEQWGNWGTERGWDLPVLPTMLPMFRRKARNKSHVSELQVKSQTKLVPLPLPYLLLFQLFQVVAVCLYCDALS